MKNSKIYGISKIFVRIKIKKKIFCNLSFFSIIKYNKIIIYS